MNHRSVARSSGGRSRRPAGAAPRRRRRAICATSGVDVVEPAPGRGSARRSRAPTWRAVEVEVVAVEHVGLDAALGAVEGRVGADATPRPGSATSASAYGVEHEPRGVDAVGGDRRRAASSRGWPWGSPARGRGGRRAPPCPRRGADGRASTPPTAHVAGARPGRGRRSTTTRRPRPRAAATRVDDEAALAPELGEGLGVAGGPVAEAEVLAHDDRARVEPVDEHVVDELLGRHAARARVVNGTTQTASTPSLGQQRAPVVERREQPRVRAGPHDLVGVRVEGDDDDGQPHARGACSTARPTTTRWPQWTPSKTPMVTTDAGWSSGTSARSARHEPSPARYLATQSAAVRRRRRTVARSPSTGSATDSTRPSGSAKTPTGLRPRPLGRRDAGRRAARATVGGLVDDQPRRTTRRRRPRAARSVEATPRARRACGRRSRPNGPTRVRRSAVRWPPTPSAAPRSRASART